MSGAAPRAAVLSKLRKFRPSKGKTSAPDQDFLEEARKIRTQLLARKRAARWIFRPGESSLLNKWDVLGAFMLLYTATFTPLEVAFLDAPSDYTAWTKPRFLINRLLDLYFLLDLIAQAREAPHRSSRAFLAAAPPPAASACLKND